jgi:hypothetical protein
MAEEWRLSISFTDQPGAGKRFYYGTAARKVLRSRFGNDVVISAEKSRIFLYTERADLGREAELATRQVLAQQGLLADIRLDRWDPSDQVWRDAWSDEPEPDAPGPLGVGAGNPAATTEALTNIILGGLDAINFIP